MLRQNDEVVFKDKERTFLSGQNDDDMRLMEDACYFGKYMIAIYGGKGYAILHGPSGIVALSGGCLSCQRSFSKSRIQGDNVCGCNEIGLIKELGIEPEDLAYLSFRTGVVAIPYCICVDKKRQRVVLAIRGTLSLEDLLSDITVRPVSLKQLGQKFGFEGDGEYAHSGMLASAEWLVKDLEKNQVLQKLLLNHDAPYREYEFTITGHSLGAGCAAILALLLQKDFPSLRCFCFAPPAVVSRGLVEQPYVTSFVVGVDG